MGGIADAINSLLQVIQGQQKILESAVSNNPSTIKRGRKKKQDETTDSGGVAEEGGGGGKLCCCKRAWFLFHPENPVLRHLQLLLETLCLMR